MNIKPVDPRISWQIESIIKQIDYLMENAPLVLFSTRLKEQAHGDPLKAGNPGYYQNGKKKVNRGTEKE